MDDTIVVSRSKKACEELLERIERISGQYGLELNKDKCVNLNMNTEEQQTFRGRNKLMKAEEATYLGNTLNCKANAVTEVENRCNTEQLLEGNGGKQQMATTYI